MTFNYNRYIEELLEQEQQNQGSPYQNLKRMTGKVYKTGKNMASVGDYMQNNFSNPTMQKVGSFLNKNGQSIANGANNVNNVISPQNYFKGFAPKPFSGLSGSATSGTAGAGSGATAGGAASTVGTLPPMGMGAAAGTGAGTSAIGNAIGSEVAGTAAGGSALTGAISSAAPMATTAGLGAGTAAGAGSLAGGTAAGGAAAGAGGAAAGGAAGAGAGGAAAGGAAAGGGAASGAAAAGPIGALVALGVMAAMGTNRKRAKKSGQALLSSLNKEGEAALNQTNEFAKNANNQIQDYSQQMLPTNNNYNGIAGSAAPLTMQDLNAQAYNGSPITQAIQQQQQQGGAISNAVNEQMPDMQTILNQGGVADNVQAPLTAEAIQEETIKRGLLDKLFSGAGDFYRGFNENLNNGFKPENLNADKFTETVVNPADTQKIADLQSRLLNDAGYNDWANRAGVDKAAAINAIAEGKNSGNADVADWIKNNQDAYKETKETKTYDKGKMARLGEFMGSAARIAQNPLAQGLLAGGLSAALTGNPLYGLGQGYKFANNRAMSNIYGDVLKQYGVNVPNTGMFGNISGTDMRNIGNMAETHAWHEYLNQKNADELARKVAKDQADKEYKENRIQVQQQNANTNQQRVNNQKNKPQTKTQSGDWQLIKGKDGVMYQHNKRTGEYKILGEKTPLLSNSGEETEEQFRNRVFKNKGSKSNNNNGWAF